MVMVRYGRLRVVLRFEAGQEAGEITVGQFLAAELAGGDAFLIVFAVRGDQRDALRDLARAKRQRLLVDALLQLLPLLLPLLFLLVAAVVATLRAGERQPAGNGCDRSTQCLDRAAAAKTLVTSTRIGQTT